MDDFDYMICLRRQLVMLNRILKNSGDIRENLLYRKAALKEELQNLKKPYPEPGGRKG